MPPISLTADVVVIGAGLAGILAAHEALDRGRKVVLLDKDSREKFGGLAKESFGGVHMIGTPHQRRMRIEDGPELAWNDWEATARFGPDDAMPRAWARHYCENSVPDVFEPLDKRGVTFLPLVNWPERGVHVPGNSVPRWHIAWGTGHAIAERAILALEAHPKRANLQLLFDAGIDGFEIEAGRVVGARGKTTTDGAEIAIRADAVVVASGGICGGDLSKVRANWYKPWGDPPEKLLNGAHKYGDGLLHDRVAEMGGSVTHLDKQWHYAAGVHHPRKSRPNDGLSLVPPRSALWFDAIGERIMNPGPMPTYGDTRHMVESVLRRPGKYSWQVMNWQIAIRELAVSGCDYMEDFRYKRKLGLAKTVLFGNPKLVKKLIADCPEDIVVADRLDDLIEGMRAKTLYGLNFDGAKLAATVHAWDAMIARGRAYYNDEQLRRLENFRAYRGDKIRMAKASRARLTDPRNGPLIAIREFILSRKSLGGIRTDLQCRALRAGSTEPVPGLYAVGEAAGFGGGGIHGVGSLEGTFLGGCVLTARALGRALG